MRFRLTYEGSILATQGDAFAHQIDRRAAYKHEIRRVFHRQLKQLWQTNDFLNSNVGKGTFTNPRPITDTNAYWGAEDRYLPMAEAVARNYEEFGYRFVPLVRKDLSLLCSLRILFLRRDIPGHVISAGDIDNRIKTIIDGLRKPAGKNELEGNELPKDGENPFYCLLENDNQVTHLEVETDTLLDEPTKDNADASRSRLVITVEVRPYKATYLNLGMV
jgi:hypothetical protein